MPKRIFRVHYLNSDLRHRPRHPATPDPVVLQISVASSDRATAERRDPARFPSSPSSDPLHPSRPVIRFILRPAPLSPLPVVSQRRQPFLREETAGYSRAAGLEVACTTNVRSFSRAEVCVVHTHRRESIVTELYRAEQNVRHRFSQGTRLIRVDPIPCYPISFPEKNRASYRFWITRVEGRWSPFSRSAVRRESTTRLSPLYSCFLRNSTFDDRTTVRLSRKTIGLESNRYQHRYDEYGGLPKATQSSERTTTTTTTTTRPGVLAIPVQRNGIDRSIYRVSESNESPKRRSAGRRRERERERDQRAPTPHHAAQCSASGRVARARACAVPRPREPRLTHTRPPQRSGS